MILEYLGFLFRVLEKIGLYAGPPFNLIMAVKLVIRQRRLNRDRARQSLQMQAARHMFTESERLVRALTTAGAEWAIESSEVREAMLNAEMARTVVLAMLDGPLAVDHVWPARRPGRLFRRR